MIISSSFAFVIFLISSSLITAQPADQVDFFPISSGNYWFYRDITYPPDTFSMRMYRDTVDSEGNILAWSSSGLFNRDLQNRVWKIIDTTNNIQILQYMLDADSGETWQVYRDEGSERTESAEVTGVFSIILFGKKVTVKKIEFFIEYDSNPDEKFWAGTDFLADGFGLVRWDAEPGIQYLVTGAIIGGVRWGDLATVIEESENRPRIALSLYPNPAKDEITIRYMLGEPGMTSLEIVNASGQTVDRMDAGEGGEGTWELKYDVSAIPLGIYYIVIRCGKFSNSQPIVIE